MLSVALPVLADVIVVTMFLWLLPRGIGRALHLDHAPGAVGTAAVLAGALYLFGAQFFALRIAEAATTHAYAAVWPTGSELEVQHCVDDIKARYELKSRDFVDRAIGANPARLPSPSEIEQVEIIAFEAMRTKEVMGGPSYERRLMNHALRVFCTPAPTVSMMAAAGG